MSTDPNSEYNRVRDDRTRINNLVGLGRESNTDFLRCSICLEKWRLILKDIDGVKKWWCHGCGKTFDLEQTQTQEKTPKYRTKYPTITKSFILSKAGKKNDKRLLYDSVNSQLSEEDRDDIRKSLGAEPN